MRLARSPRVSTAPTLRFTLLLLGLASACSLSGPPKGDPPRGSAVAPSAPSSADPMAFPTPPPPIARTVDAAGSWSCAIVEGGAVECWGRIPGRSASPTPVRIDHVADATHIAMSAQAACARTARGALWCWGLLEDRGREETAPVEVASAGVRQVAVQDGVAYFAREQAPVLQLSGGRVERPISLPARLVEIVAAGELACLLDAQGAVSCLGSGAHRGSVCRAESSRQTCWSQGSAPPENDFEPQPISGLPPVRRIALSRRFLCGLTTEGRSIACGQLEGDGTVSAIPLVEAEDIVELAVSSAEVCARDVGGAVRCADLRSEAPVLRDAELSPVDGIALGLRHGCARMLSGETWCWGANARGQLGRPADVSALREVDFGGPVREVAGAGRHLCALLEDGAVSCFDDRVENPFASMGEVTPRRVLDAGADALSVGPHHGCLLAEGEMRCWGADFQGRVTGESPGRGYFEDELATLPVEEPTRIMVNPWRSCARTANDDVPCWGTQRMRRGGDDVREPGHALPFGVGEQESCAVVPDGGITCWQRDVTDRVTYYEPEGLSTARDVVVGDNHSCALQEDGTVACWSPPSSRFRGFARDDETAEAPLAAPVADLSGVTQLSGHDTHRCALLDDGTVRCWGPDDLGQIGPAGRGEVRGADGVLAGYGVSCAWADGVARCWGLLPHRLPPAPVGSGAAEG